MTDDTTLADAWSDSSGTIAERIAQMRSRPVQRPRPIPARDVKRLWGQRMILAAALEASRAPDVPKPLRILCRATYDNLMGDLFGDLDPADPAQATTITAFLDGLHAAGVLSDAVRAETLALGQVAEYPFQNIGLPDLHKAGLITAADAGVGE